MRLLKLLLGALALPLLALAGLGFLLPSQWRVERALAFDVPAPAVATYVRDLRHWPEFSPWASSEPGAVSFNGPADGVGGAIAFAGSGLREGTLTLTQVDPAKGVSFAVAGGGWGRDCKGSLTAIPVGGRVRVSFSAEGKLRGYLGRYLLPVLQMNVGGEIEQALLALKAKLQSPGVSPPAAPGPTVVTPEPTTAAAASIADDVEQPLGDKPPPAQAEPPPAQAQPPPKAEEPAPSPAPPEPAPPPSAAPEEPASPAPAAADGEQVPQ